MSPLGLTTEVGTFLSDIPQRIQSEEELERKGTQQLTVRKDEYQASITLIHALFGGAVTILTKKVYENIWFTFCSEKFIGNSKLEIPNVGTTIYSYSIPRSPLPPTIE